MRGLTCHLAKTGNPIGTAVGDVWPFGGPDVEQILGRAVRGGGRARADRVRTGAVSRGGALILNRQMGCRVACEWSPGDTYR
jgi:hypothetical protein